MRGGEAIAERPDGVRIPFIPYPTPLHDAAGRVTGAVNMLVDIRGALGRICAAQRSHATAFLDDWENDSINAWGKWLPAVRSLGDLIAEVIATAHECERDVQDKDGRWYSLRVRPYLTHDHKVDGAVLVGSAPKG